MEVLATNRNSAKIQFKFRQNFHLNAQNTPQEFTLLLLNENVITNKYFAGILSVAFKCNLVTQFMGIHAQKNLPLHLNANLIINKNFRRANGYI